MKRAVFGSLALCALAVTAAPAAAQGFGRAVAAGEGEVFVAEPAIRSAPGAVYVFRGEEGAWEEATRLFAPDSAPGDGFGRSLAVDGPRLLVGAAGADGEPGAAHLFERREGAWRPVATLTRAGAERDDGFGAAAALRGDLAAVAAPGTDSVGGAVHVFRRDAGGAWAEEARLAPEEPRPGDGFGTAVALGAEGRIAVGAPRPPRRGEEATGPGAVHVFRHDPATGSWILERTLAPEGVEESVLFGSALAFHGDRLLVGASGYDNGRGAVFTFALADGSGEEERAWREGPRLLPFAAERPDRFGSSLAADADRVLVGAPLAVRFGGRVFAYEAAEDPTARARGGLEGETSAPAEDGAGDDGAGSGFASVSRLDPAEVEQGDRLGSAVALAGDLAVAGVAGADYGAGAALIYERVDGTWRAAARVVSEPRGFDAVTGGTIPCGEGGTAARFRCEDVDLVSFLPVRELGGERGVRVNDIWGWTDPETGREVAIVGRVDGTSFVDVSDPENPRYLGDLPRTEGTPASTWRDIKVYRNHAFIVADGAEEHGMQVFDLTKLREVEEPVTFEQDAHYDRIASAHNIVIDTATGYAYTVGNSGGGTTCGGGLHMIDIREPTSPAFAGCFSDESTGRRRTGYTHDAQCVVYGGPDGEHRGREVCFGANETALSIADVTDKENPVALSAVSYPNVGYTHQGWLTEDQRYFFLNDELDEIQGSVENTRTLIWDVSDLDDPLLVGEYLGPTRATDHNLYIVGDRMYQSNYVSGLRIVDIADPENPREVAHFDTVPYGEDDPGFGGSWSNYPYFESGVVVVTSGQEGLFVLRPQERELVP